MDIVRIALCMGAVLFALLFAAESRAANSPAAAAGAAEAQVTHELQGVTNGANRIIHGTEHVVGAGVGAIRRSATNTAAKIATHINAARAARQKAAANTTTTPPTITSPDAAAGTTTTTTITTTTTTGPTTPTPPAAAGN